MINNSNLDAILNNFDKYVDKAEYRETKRAFKKQFNQSKMSEVIHVISQSIENQGIDIQSLKNLRKSIIKLGNKEKQAMEIGESILHKANTIVRLFYLLFNNKNCNKQLQQTHRELNNLKMIVDKKITKLECEEMLQKHNINDETLKEGKQQFNDFIHSIVSNKRIAEHQEKWLDFSFVDFSQSLSFQQSIQEAGQSFQTLSNAKKQVQALEKLFKTAIKDYCKFLQKQHLDPEARLQMMVLIVLKLDISPDFFKLKAELNLTDKKSDLGLTLANLESAMAYIVKCIH